VKHESKSDGRSKELEVFSPTADLIDSTPAEPYELNNQSLQQICKKRCRPFGIDVVIDDGIDADTRFKRATADKTSSIFDHLSSLAKQRGLLLSSTIEGDLLITGANVQSQPVGTIEEGFPQSQDYSISFNGRGRFNTYKAISQTPKKRGVSSIVVDKVVPKPRRMTFINDSTLSGELTEAAEWKKNKTLAESLTIPFPYTDWFDPQGNLWEVNTLVTVKSPTLGIEKGFTFLIRQIEFILETGERSVVLGLVPPSLYTKENIEEPWVLE
jgi:prophage tail gpP-like protein